MSDATPDLDIRCDETGVAVYERGTHNMHWTIRWDEIIEIAVWKCDLLAVDLICLGVRWRGAETYKEVDEEMPGWRELLTEIEARFGVAEESWWRDVALPPFEEQFHVIWRAESC